MGRLNGTLRRFTGSRNFSKPLTELVARDANEGDTRLLVTDFLCEGLGYDTVPPKGSVNHGCKSAKRPFLA